MSISTQFSKSDTPNIFYDGLANLQNQGFKAFFYGFALY